MAFNRRTARSFLRRYAVLLATVLLAACSTTPPPEQTTPIIPESTRVADVLTLDALTSFDLASGEMRFSAATQALLDLRLDDVLVGEPTEAAPDGFLRRVHAVELVGDEVVVQTSQANLIDAIHQGELQATGFFGPEDLLEPRVYAAGVTVEAIADAGPVRLAERMATGVWDDFEAVEPSQIGQGYNFRVGLDEVLLDLNADGVRVRVQVTGEIYFNAGYGVGVSIRTCWELPPVCLRRFEASVGFEQTARIRVQGEASAALNVEKLVASIPFSPIVLFIGPVPVVFIPSVDVYVGGSGEVRLSFDYGVTERFAAMVGARWTSSNGWQDITDFGLYLDGYDQFDVNATFKASVYVKPEAKLMLYGLVGPAAVMTAGIELDAAIPRNPMWRVRGFLRGDVAFQFSLPVIGKLAEYRSNLFDFGIDGRSSPNTPPEVTVRQPRLRVPLRASVRLYDNYTVRDMEDGSPTVTLRSSHAGDAVQYNRSYAFLSTGVRTLTLEAVDSGGLRTTRTFEVDVYNPPPSVFAAVVESSIRQSGGPNGYMVPLTISLGASDPVDGRLGCSAITVQVTAPDTVTRTDQGGGLCEAVVHFHVQGERHVLAYATDQDGLRSSTKSYALNVLPPPDGPPPQFDSGILVDGVELPAGTRIRCWPTGGWRFSVQASDPSGLNLPLTYSWTLRHWDQQPSGPVGILWPEPDGRVHFPNHNGLNPMPDWHPPGDAVGGPWIFAVAVSNGETTVSRTLIFGWSPYPCVN